MATGRKTTRSASGATPKKAADPEGAEKPTGYKYSDKTAGQEQLLPIFERLVRLLSPYAKGDMVKRGGKGGEVSLVLEKDLVVAGRPMKELHFAAALVQKGYVGFYFMPVYAEPAMKEKIAPELLRCLKGKSCFHIKKDDEQLYTQIADALEKGYALYKKKGWIA